MCFAPTTACTFSTSQLPKVVRAWCAVYILTSKCASRHNGVQFFISHLASWLRTRRLASLLFDPPESQIIGKTQCLVSRLSYLFAHLHLLSSDSFSSTLLSSNLSLLSASALLCFSSVHIVRSLTSKLPSTSVFARHWHKNLVNTVFLLPEAKNIVNTVVFGFRSVTNIGIFAMLLLRGFQKYTKNKHS